MYEEIREKLGKIGIIPVVVLEDAKDAAPLGEALMKGGLPAAEVTFRTDAAEEAIEVMREIETACGIPFTAIVNNSNIGEETTAEDVRESFSDVKRLSELTKLPILFTSVKESLLNEFEGEEILPLRLQNKII